jgi:peptidoglycan/xylan/chitin deacetylase (PgdA/CDA1 family)
MMSFRRRPVVLMYHGFCHAPRSGDDLNLFVTVHALVAQLRMLERAGWTPMDLDGFLEELDRPGSGPPKSFLVTIDDGYRSVLELAWPVFRAAGVSPVLFVPPDRVGGDAGWMADGAGEGLLGWDELRRLVTEGVELGVHGLDHTVLAGLPRAELGRQVIHAKEQLEMHAGVRARAFAYPEGVWDEPARSAVAAAGYDVAFTVHDGSDRFTVSRIDVTALDTSRSLRLKLVVGYRTWWRAAGRLGGLRPLVRHVVSGSRPGGKDVAGR